MTADAGSPPRSKQQLIDRVFEEWRKIPECFIKQLYASISKRLSTVDTARRYSTKYLFDLKVTSVFNFELWKSKKLYLSYGFIELVFLFACPLADKTRANQATTKLIGVIRHLLASEVLQYFCPPSVHMKRLFWHILLHQLAEICGKQRLLASTWASKF